MVKLKNNNVVQFVFVVFLTFLLFSRCGTSKLDITKIEGKQIPIGSEIESNQKVVSFIQPYKQHIDQELNAVLAIATETIDKSGVWQSPMGNLFSKAVFEKGNPIFEKRENKTIDFVLLNHGGIRTIIPKGNVTARSAFEIMPFENSLVVVALAGEQVEELLQYFVNEKKPHPLFGISFTIEKNNTVSNILVQGKPFSKETTYYVGTNDYLANGGDNMTFFKKGIQRYNLDYKLRNILIDYFKEVKTLSVDSSERVKAEP